MGSDRDITEEILEEIRSQDDLTRERASASVVEMLIAELADHRILVLPHAKIVEPDYGWLIADSSDNFAAILHFAGDLPSRVKKRIVFSGIIALLSIAQTSGYTAVLLEPDSYDPADKIFRGLNDPRYVETIASIARSAVDPGAAGHWTGSIETLGGAGKLQSPELQMLAHILAHLQMPPFRQLKANAPNLLEKYSSIYYCLLLDRNYPQCVRGLPHSLCPVRAQLATALS